MDADGFTIVKLGKTRSTSRNINTKIHVKKDELVEIDVAKTIKSINSAKGELMNAEFLSEIISSLQEIGKNEQIVNIHSYGLGQLSASIARYQTAFILLIKQYLSIPDEKNFVFDPIFNSDEKTVLKDLGFTVLEENTSCKIRLQHKTLVFLPHCPKELTNNLLFANLKNQQQRGTSVSNLVLVSNSISSVLTRTPAKEIADCALILQLATDSGIVKESNINNNFKYNDIFNDLSLHTFSSPNSDLLHGIDEPVYKGEASELINGSVK